MKCDVVTTREALTKSLNRAESLKKTMNKTREGELLDNTIDVRKRAIEALDKRDFVEFNRILDEEFVSDPVSLSVIEQVGGEVQAAVGENPNSASTRKSYTIKSAEYVNDDTHGEMIKLTVSDGNTYTFKAGNTRSTHRFSGDKVMYIPNFAPVVDKAIEAAKGIDSYEEHKKVAVKASEDISKAYKALDSDNYLGSSEDISEDSFKYKKNSKVSNFRFGNVEDMKNKLLELNAKTSNQASTENLNWYEKLIGSMHEHFFRDMDLFINYGQDTAKGWLDLDKKRMLLNVSSNTDSSMSNAEVYTHELIHAITAWALRTKSDRTEQLKERLNYLRNQAHKNIRWQDLLRTDDKLKESTAKQRYDYIFGDNANDDEFLAYALTNPGFMELVKGIKLHKKKPKGFWNSVVQFFEDILNSVMGRYDFSRRDGTVHEEIVALVLALGEVNGKADDKAKSDRNMFNTLSEWVVRYEGKWEELTEKLSDKVFDKTGELVVPENPNHVQKVMFLAKFFTKAIYNPDYRHQLGRFMSMYTMSNRLFPKGVGKQLLPATSSIREVMRNIFPQLHDHITASAKYLGLQANTMEARRNSEVGETARSIINGFKKMLSKEEEVALTNIIMESNAQTLFDKNKNGGKGYSVHMISKMLSDTGYRMRAIARAKTKIRKLNAERANWIIGQAEGLGIYMATGKGHPAQNTNSHNIVRGYLSSKRYGNDHELEAWVEELASLTAIHHQRPTTKDKVGDGQLVADLLKTEEEGVRNVVNLYGAFIAESKRQLFDGDASHIIEGYARELFDETIETTHAPMSKRAELEAAGFELKNEFEVKDLSGGEPIGYFINNSALRPERLSGAVILGNTHSRGMTLKQVRFTQFGEKAKQAMIWFEADKAHASLKASEINKKLNSGTSISEIENGPIPVLDAEGNAVDYRYSMPKYHKQKLLNQNKGIVDVLSKTVGTVVYKQAKAEINKKAEQIITKHIREVYDNPKSKDNQMEHTLVSPDSVDPEIRKLFYQLPRNIQNIALKRKDNSLPIPSILMDTYFGYSHLKLTNAVGLRNLDNSIKKVIDQVEKVWTDLVSIAKGNVLLKMPAILVVNIVSNMLFAVSTGTNPVTLAKMYANSIKSVHSFMQKHKNLEKLRVDMKALTQSYYTTKFKDDYEMEIYKEDVKHLRSRISRLEKEMSESPVKELFDMGLYQAVIEDVNMYQVNETNSVTSFFDGVLDKAPGPLKTTGQVLFLTKETKWYKANQYVLQMSDLVARDVMNRKRIAEDKKSADGERDLPYWYRKHSGKMGGRDIRRKLTGKERDEFFELADKARKHDLVHFFVNYNDPNGRSEEYLNRVGILMFTKYMKRIQRVIADTTLRHPITSTATLLAASFGMDLEMIQDSSVLAKAGDDYGLFGLTPIHNPLDVIMKVVNPPLFDLAGQGADLIGTD